MSDEKCRLCAERDNEDAERMREAGRRARKLWPGPLGEFWVEYFRRAANWHAQGIYNADGTDMAVMEHILSMPVEG